LSGHARLRLICDSQIGEDGAHQRVVSRCAPRHGCGYNPNMLLQLACDHVFRRQLSQAERHPCDTLAATDKGDRTVEVGTYPGVLPHGRNAALRRRRETRKESDKAKIQHGGPIRFSYQGVLVFGIYLSEYSHDNSVNAIRQRNLP
jgi:hypothetical protein